MSKAVKVLDIDSLVPAKASTNKPSFLKPLFLHVEKVAAKSALTRRHLLPIVNRLEAALFCPSLVDLHADAAAIKGLNDAFKLVIATSKPFEELKQDAIFQSILKHVAPDCILVSGTDPCIEERLTGYLYGLGNTRTRVLVAQESKPHKSFLDPIKEWAARHAVPARKITVITEDKRLTNVARVYHNFKTKTGNYFSLFCVAT